MDTMDSNLKSYDLENIFISKDFSSWKDELSIASVEMEFCPNLFSATLNDLDIANKVKYINILDKLGLLKNENTQLRKELFALAIQFEGYVECQDLQCDNYYMTMHLAFRDKIEKHFAVYSKLKKKLLMKINK